MRILIENSSQKGDTVLEPFMGIGSTCIAANKSGRKFIGCELDNIYFDIAHNRLCEKDPVSSIITTRKDLF